jgi:hypothetical protein
MRLPSGRPRFAAGENDGLAWLRRAAAARDRLRLGYTLRPSGAHAPMVGTTLIGYHVSS